MAEAQHQLTDREAMLAGVLANPKDDNPRLVFADWLDEHDEGPLAEFIRVQCELANWEPPYSPWCKTCGWVYEQCSCADKSVHPPEIHRLDALKRRERELLESGFLRPLSWPFWRKGDGYYGWSIDGRYFQCAARRGFAAEIETTWACWRDHGDRVRREHPVECVVLTDRVDWYVASNGVWLTLPGSPNEDYHCVRATDGCWWGKEPPVVLRILEAEWPGIAFELPPEPRPDRTAYDAMIRGSMAELRQMAFRELSRDYEQQMAMLRMMRDRREDR